MIVHVYVEGVCIKRSELHIKTCAEEWMTLSRLDGTREVCGEYYQW